MSGWIARGMTTPTPVSRGEFGVIGAARILALLKKHDIPATWFVPGHTLETYPKACERVLEAGHEIGHHGWTHVPPASLSRDEEEAELVRANEQIKKLTGRYARGYRIELQKPAVFGKESRLIEMPISWSLDDYPHFEFVRAQNAVLPGLKNASGVLANWIDDFLYMKRETDWGVLTYTFHPFVIGRGHRMMALERLIERLAAEGAEFMRMDAAAESFDRRSPYK